MAQNNIFDRKFISYCRTSLLNKSIDLKKQKSICIAKEISIEDLSFYDFNQLLYRVDFDQKENELEFQILLHKLYEALSLLSQQDRDIIFLKYWENMTDQQIADQLKLVRRTVNYSRHKSLKQLRKYLEED